jgi:lipid-A-disaccharide synthase
MVRSVDVMRETLGLDVDVAIGRAPTIDRTLLESLAPGVAVADPPSVDLVAASDLVLCASGTATVEVALTGTPMVVLYRLSRLSWFLARRMVKLRQVAMANLVAQDSVVPELLQDDATEANLAHEAASILRSDERRKRIQRGYALVRRRLEGGVGLDEVAARALALVDGTGRLDGRPR